MRQLLKRDKEDFVNNFEIAASRALKRISNVLYGKAYGLIMLADMVMMKRVNRESLENFI